MSKIVRCKWCEVHPLLMHYHDTEWGMPSSDDRHHFEHIALEIFQSGLNWLTILKKRDNFRRAFADFSVDKIALFDDRDISRLLNDSGIIRNRVKIQSVVNNAGKFLAIQREFGSFFSFALRFKPSELAVYDDEEQIPARTAESEALAAELRKRGFKFIGPVAVYAYMQSIGLVNDHIRDCFRFVQIEEINKKTLKSIDFS